MAILACQIEKKTFKMASRKKRHSGTKLEKFQSTRGNTKNATCAVDRAGTAYSCCRSRLTVFD